MLMKGMELKFQRDDFVSPQAPLSSHSCNNEWEWNGRELAADNMGIWL